LYLEQQLALASTHGLTNRVIELSLLQAQAWRAQGKDAALGGTQASTRRGATRRLSPQL